MTNRRQFLAGLLASGTLPAATWADAGSPTHLSAAARDDGEFVLCGLGRDQSVMFQIPLPGRGHAAAAHPNRPEAVAFARRPGTFALVIDCSTGAVAQRLTAPDGRHFYGHGAFSLDGSLLYTTENDYENGWGCIGVWDVVRGYRRVDEWDSGGIGPHELRRLPGTETLVVANGGIETHPDSGRSKLNIPTMEPNLAYIDAGQVIETAALPRALHKNSIRHLAVSGTGLVGIGMQWQGDLGEIVPLMGIHRRGQSLELLHCPDEAQRGMNGYIGSLAFTADGAGLFATSPRGGRVHRYDVAQRKLMDEVMLEDACGVAQAPDQTDGVIVTSGTGGLWHMTQTPASQRQLAGLHWDNHLIALS